MASRTVSNSAIFPGRINDPATGKLNLTNETSEQSNQSIQMYI